MRQGCLTAVGQCALSALLCWSALTLIYGCQPHPAAGQDLTAERCQLLDRAQWQWVPPYSQVVNGSQVIIPGHWHNRFGACQVCGDRTTRPGTVAQANPQLPAAQATPAAPTAQAAPNARHDECARLAAELAAAQGRLRKVEDVLTAHHASLAEVRDDLQLLGEGVTQLDRATRDLSVAVKGLGPRLTGIEDAAATDRAAFGRRVADAARTVVVTALREHSVATGLTVALEGLSLGGPLGLGVAVGGWLLARAVRHRRPERRQANDAGAEEAPADDPFRCFPAEAQDAAAAEAATAELHTFGVCRDCAGEPAATADPDGERVHPEATDG